MADEVVEVQDVDQQVEETVPAWKAEMTDLLGDDEESSPPVEEEPPAEGEDNDPPPPDESEDVDDVLDKLPEDAPGHTDNWKRLRDAYAEKKKDNQELRDKLKAFEEGEEDQSPVNLSIFGVGTEGDGQGQPPPNGQQQETATPEFVFDTLAKIENGEVEESYRSSCEELIDQMAPQDILGVISKARSRAFGDASDQILKDARQRLPEVQQAHGARQQQEDSVKTAQVARVESLKNIARLPGMQDHDSAEFKGYMDAGQELAQRIPHLQHQVDFPEVVQEYVQLKNQASQVTALREENENLKRKLGISQSPQSSGSPPSSSNRNGAKTWQEEMREELASLES